MSGAAPNDQDAVTKDQTETVRDVLASHILFGYGACSCGHVHPVAGRYSADQRAHVAQAIVAALNPDR